MFPSTETTLDFRLHTNEVIPAQLALKIVGEIVRIARLKRNYGPNAEIEIIEMGRGSLYAKIMISGSLAAVGSLLLQLTSTLESGNGKLAELVATACLEHGVRACQFKSEDAEFTILREDMPAVDRIEHGLAHAILEGPKDDGKVPRDHSFLAASSNMNLIPGNVTIRPTGRRAFIGQIRHEGREPVFVTVDGVRFRLRGKIDWDAIDFGKDYVIVGSSGDHDTETGHDFLDVDEILIMA